MSAKSFRFGFRFGYSSGFSIGLLVASAFIIALVLIGMRIGPVVMPDDTSRINAKATPLIDVPQPPAD
jgi:hypothetical protein